MRMGQVLALVLLGVLPLLAVAQTAPSEAPAKGTTVGILVAKGDAWMQVKGETDKEAIRYIPFWRGGMPADGGGPDKEIVAAIKKLPVSNLVEVAWEVQEKSRRIVSVKIIAPEKKEGTVDGVVTAKGENWIDVKPKDGPTERYMARWIGGMPKDGGGMDKAMVAAIAAAKLGDTVQVKWLFDERKRAVSLTVTAPAPEKQADKPSETTVQK